MNAGSGSTNQSMMTEQGEFIRACSWCDKVEGTDGQWNDMIPEIRQVYESGMRLTHGMCPPCYTQNAAIMTD